MHIIQPKTSVNISDRNVLTISNQIDNKELGNKFILAKNCSLVSDSLSANGTFAVVTDEICSINVEEDGGYLIINTPGYNPIEHQMSFIASGKPGNLSYIDGCSNSNIIHPPRNGDPCINYLYIPPFTEQTFHTHPSLRIGMILGGEGVCNLKNGPVKLEKNLCFVLDRHEHHRFMTNEHALWLMVFHPDSEDGPRDEFNPMKTRTYVK